ncbi:MAG: hypothetical protein ACYCXT_13050, partial [Acidiferrobacteraceae bacterium]
ASIAVTLGSLLRGRLQMAHHSKPSRTIWVLLGWLAYMLLVPLQLSASTLPITAIGSAAQARWAQGASMHMPMGILDVSACVQLQCHAAPAIGNHAPHNDGRVAPPVLAITVPTTLGWQETPTRLLRTAPPPPLRSDPVRYARPARLLI